MGKKRKAAAVSELSAPVSASAPASNEIDALFAAPKRRKAEPASTETPAIKPTKAAKRAKAPSAPVAPAAIEVVDQSARLEQAASQSAPSASSSKPAKGKGKTAAPDASVAAVDADAAFADSRGTARA